MATKGSLHSVSGRVSSKKFDRSEANRLRTLALNDLIAYGVKLLQQTPVMAQADLENRCHRRFQAIMTTEDYCPLAGQSEESGRMKWQNLVDWVKARLTMDRRTTYLDLNDVRYIVYLEKVGTVFGHDVCRFTDARAVLTLIARLTKN